MQNNSSVRWRNTATERELAIYYKFASDPPFARCCIICRHLHLGILRSSLQFYVYTVKGPSVIGPLKVDMGHFLMQLGTCSIFWPK